MPPSLEQQAREKAIEDARLAERLRTMKSAVDNKPPPSFGHIGGNNSKKLTQDKARQAEIDQGNARLLNNLTSIASGGASMDTGLGKDKPLSRGEAPRHAGPSMQTTQQKQESERIALENQRMLQRITQTAARTTEYSPSALQKSQAEHDAHLARISRFPKPK